MSKKKMNHGTKRAQEAFNQVTQSVKPENQNQTHNVKKEGITPVNQQR
jgi:hypothetical protein